MASKSYGWDVRNIAKISPEMVKKRAIFRLQKKIPKPTPLPHMRLWSRFETANEFYCQFNFHTEERENGCLLFSARLFHDSTDVFFQF